MHVSSSTGLCRHSLTGSTVAYSSLHVISLRAEQEEEGGGNIVKKCVFKTRPIMDVQCNRRYDASGSGHFKYLLQFYSHTLLDL